MADLTTAKLLINSTMSTLGPKVLGIDLTKFYLNLNTPMPNPEYMHLHLEIIPDKIILHYNLCDIVTPKGWVYIEIQKGMYGLPQVGILANQLLEKRLTTKGYYQCQHKTGLWSYVWRNITFCLVINDFGIKVTNMHNMDHLVETLKEHYTIAVDFTGSLFCSIQLTWNYAQRHFNCHMPGYINKALTKYQHPKPVTPQHALYKAAPIQYGARVQRVKVNTTQPITPNKIKQVQDIVSTLLYYARVVDPTLLAALSTIAAQQANVTRAVADACHQLLDYVATYPNAGIQYKVCNMVLSIDPSYLPNQVVKVVRQDIFTYQIAIRKTSTMAPYSPCQPSSNTSCH
jgi:hypothetical protein